MGRIKHVQHSTFLNPFQSLNIIYLISPVELTSKKKKCPKREYCNEIFDAKFCIKWQNTNINTYFIDSIDFSLHTFIYDFRLSMIYLQIRSSYQQQITMYHKQRYILNIYGLLYCTLIWIYTDIIIAKFACSLYYV